MSCLVFDPIQESLTLFKKVTFSPTLFTSTDFLFSWLIMTPMGQWDNLSKGESQPADVRLIACAISAG